MTSAVLIYDGNCPICLTSIRFIRRNSVMPELEFLPFQTAECTQRFPDLSLETLNRSLTFVTETRDITTEGWAIRHILVDVVDTPTWILSLFNVPGAINLVSILYKIIARNRYNLSRWFRSITAGTVGNCFRLINSW